MRWWLWLLLALAALGGCYLGLRNYSECRALGGSIELCARLLLR